MDVQSLIKKLGTVYNSNDWCLFINVSKSSLKAVLLHNTNQFASIALACSTCMKESYENIKLLLSKIQYSTHVWKICVDFKVLNMLFGQQSGFIKYLVSCVNGTGLIIGLNVTGHRGSPLHEVIEIFYILLLLTDSV